jgi:hypothetical protein
MTTIQIINKSLTQYNEFYEVSEFIGEDIRGIKFAKLRSLAKLKASYPVSFKIVCLFNKIFLKKTCKNT